MACLATLAGCAGPALKATPSPSTQSATVVPAAAWPERLQQWLPADVLLLGEQHDAPDHQRLQRETVAWLASRGQRLEDFDRSWFYSDSRNDIPLMSVVTHPVAVNPDELLRAHAEAHGWPVMFLHD